MRVLGLLLGLSCCWAVDPTSPKSAPVQAYAPSFPAWPMLPMFPAWPARPMAPAWPAMPAMAAAPDSSMMMMMPMMMMMGGRKKRGGGGGYMGAAMSNPAVAACVFKCQTNSGASFLEQGAEGFLQTAEGAAAAPRDSSMMMMMPMMMMMGGRRRKTQGLSMSSPGFASCLQQCQADPAAFANAEGLFDQQEGSMGDNSSA